ncbi:uncharacterized [Tachysurus ichikawai]
MLMRMMVRFRRRRQGGYDALRSKALAGVIQRSASEKEGRSVLEGLSATLIVLLTVNRVSILATWPSSVKAVTDGSLVSADHLPSTAAAVASSITHPAPVLLALAANSCCSIVSFTLSATKLAEQLSRTKAGRGNRGEKLKYFKHAGVK